MMAVISRLIDIVMYHEYCVYEKVLYDMRVILFDTWIVCGWSYIVDSM